MTNVRYFEGKIKNPKVATFEIDQDLLGPFGKLIIGKVGELQKYSPLAQALFTQKGSLAMASATRVDLIARDGKTYLGIATSKLAKWDEAAIRDVERYLVDFFSKSTPAVLTDAIESNIEVQKPFTPSGSDEPYHNLIIQTFNDHVVPILREDAGDMEILNIEIKEDGEIDVNVGLIGSCNDCPVAKSGTLSGAKSKLEEILTAAKDRYTNNARLQTLSIGEINIKPLREAAILKPS